MSISINLNSTTDAGGGIDVMSVVQQILDAERGPENLWKAQQSTLNLQSSAWTSISSNLGSLLNKVNALKDLSGALTQKTVTSSNPEVLSATVQPGAAIGTHTVVINNLATTSSYYTGSLASGSTTFATGTFRLQIGSNAPVDITVDSTRNTLDSLAAYLNSQNLGVTASVVNDASGARLALVSQTTGQPGDLSITSNSTGLSFTKSATGTNASLTIDSVPISSGSNTVSGALPGVTLQLLGPSSGPVQLSVTADSTNIKRAINEFVSSYNAVISAINLQYKVDPKTYTAGSLAADSTLRSVQSGLLKDVTFAISGNNGFTGLASFGVNMENDGTLTVDDAKLSDVISNHLSELQTFFQSASPAGFGYNFATDLAQVTSTEGSVHLDQDRITKFQSQLTQQINQLEDRLAMKQKMLIIQYSQVDAALRQFPLLMQQITNQLSALSNNK